MPPIQRKILGPESSVPWRLYLDPSTENIQTPLDSSKQAGDEKKGVYLKVGVLTHVKGSAYLEADRTKVLAAVHPPRESSKQNKKTALGCINCELKYDRSVMSGMSKTAIARSEKYLSISLKKAIEPAVCRQEFPNFQIDIVVHILEDGGSVLSSAINCAGAALVDAGVPMFDVVVASTVLVKGGNVLLNPTITELTSDGRKEVDLKEEGSVVLAQLPTCGQISEYFQKGYISFDLLKAVCKDLVNQNQQVAKIVKQVIVQKVKDSIEKENKS